MKTEVIEKNKWLSTLYDHVVDIHRNAINANGVIDFHFTSEFYFRSNTIRARNKHWVPKITLEEPLVEVQAEHTGKPPVFSKDPRTVSPSHHGLNQSNEAISRLDIDAGISVR
jgi:hypothetical protein